MEGVCVCVWSILCAGIISELIIFSLCLLESTVLEIFDLNELLLDILGVCHITLEAMI